jgi:hypothetical protein
VGVVDSVGERPAVVAVQAVGGRRVVGDGEQMTAVSAQVTTIDLIPRMTAATVVNSVCEVAAIATIDSICEVATVITVGLVRDIAVLVAVDSVCKGAAGDEREIVR